METTLRETDNIMTKRKKAIRSCNSKGDRQYNDQKKKVIRSCNSKGDNSKGDRQYNDQKKKGNQKLQL